MFFPIPEPVRRQAKSPHEMTMVNLLIFNLLTLIALMVLVMLASGAIYQAQRGEVPDRLVQRFPPPPGLTGADTEFASGAASP